MGNLSLSILLAILPFSHLGQSMPFHATRKTICLLISWGNAKESPIGCCICPFIISPFIHLFMFQNLILLKANDIWVHIWANEIFEKPCLLEPWRWSHLGQQHKGPLYRLGLNLSRISSVSPNVSKGTKVMLFTIEF
jgi:hypothetical protein